MKDEHENEDVIQDEDEFPFGTDECQNEAQYTRAKLEQLSNSKLAKIAEPKQKRFSFSTLKGKSKGFLIDIILGIKKVDIEEEKSTGKPPQTQNESQQIIQTVLSAAAAIKKIRTKDEEEELNPLAMGLFSNAAVNKVDEARANETISNDKLNNVLMIGSGLAIAIDSVIGWNNIPTLFSKVKAKFSKAG